MSYQRQREERADMVQAENNMIKIKTIEIAGFASAFQALRYEEDR